MGDLTRLLPAWTNLLILPGILAGFTVHELAHTIVAYSLGDLSQVEQKRFSVNPFRHIAWFGLITFVLFGFGWAKPVRVDPRRFKQRYLGMFFVAISGATANLLLALLAGILTIAFVTFVAIFSRRNPVEIFGLLTYIEATAKADIVAWTAAFTTYVVYANLALAFFNLLPIPTLDGFTALASLVSLLRDTSTDQTTTPASEPPPVTMQTLPVGQRARRRPADIHFELGTEYHAQGNYEDAIARYRQAIANDRHYGPAYVNMGLAHLALDQRKRAIQAFRGATQYASDEKSKTEAWTQLYKLSEAKPQELQNASPPTQAEKSVSRSETGPWTDTKPRPNWLSFALSSLVALSGAGCVYLYLIIGLIRHLS